MFRAGVLKNGNHAQMLTATAQFKTLTKNIAYLVDCSSDGIYRV
jgi:hypothetical protein